MLCVMKLRVISDIRVKGFRLQVDFRKALVSVRAYG